MASWSNEDEVTRIFDCQQVEMNSLRAFLVRGKRIRDLEFPKNIIVWYLGAKDCVRTSQDFAKAIMA